MNSSPVRIFQYILAFLVLVLYARLVYKTYPILLGWGDEDSDTRGWCTIFTTIILVFGIITIGIFYSIPGPNPAVWILFVGGILLGTLFVWRRYRATTSALHAEYGVSAPLV